MLKNVTMSTKPLQNCKIFELTEIRDTKITEICDSKLMKKLVKFG